MSGLNNRLISNNEQLTANCSMHTVPEAFNDVATNAVFADWKDSTNSTFAYGQIKALWIINPLGSGLTFWLRGPGDLSPTANNDLGIPIHAGSDTFLPMTPSALSSWGGNLEGVEAAGLPVVFVIFR